MLNVLGGVAFGLALLNTPAIILFYLLPTALTIVTSLVEWVRDALLWLDLGTASEALLEADALTG